MLDFSSYVESGGRCVVPTDDGAITYTKRNAMYKQSVPGAKYYIYLSEMVDTGECFLQY